VDHRLGDGQPLQIDPVVPLEPAHRVLPVGTRARAFSVVRIFLDRSGMRRRLRNLGLMGLAVLMTTGGCVSLRPPPRLLSTAPVVEDEEEPEDPSEGMHLRLMTDRGPVHVFAPRGYDASTAGTLVYVHGYYTDLDGAFRQQHLAAQFGNSNVNALFISPEAPSEYAEAVKWSSLQELLDLVQLSGVKLPPGSVVAMAHSGGFRTLVPWLSSGLLDTVVLLDGLYGNEEDFGAWVDDSSSEHRLLLVGADTAGRVERFVAGRGNVERSALPLPPEREADGSSRLVYLRSQIGHMELVTQGRAIPEVLRLTPLPRFDPG
jgi:hypothetical protein